MRKLPKVLTIKALPTILLLLFGVAILPGQTVDFNKVILPKAQRPATFQDYLVKLAWANSLEAEKYAYERSIAEKEVLLARREWLNDIQFSFNANEVNLRDAFRSRENQAGNFIAYPLYQIQAGVNLGTFTNNRKRREIAEINGKISDLEANQKKLEVRREVLTRYHRFKLAQDIYQVRVKTENDALSNQILATERFKNGELQLDEKLQVDNGYHQAVVNRLTAETEIELAKLELEEMIGVKWEVAERYQKGLK